MLLLLINCIILISCSTTKTNSSNILTPRWNHVFLSVSNIDTSIAFYTRAFDLQVTNRIFNLKIEQGDSAYDRKVNMAFLKFAGQDFVFELAEQPINSIISPAPHLYQHVGVEVKDIIPAFKRVQDAGGKLIVPIRTIRTNNLEIKQAHFSGPDGEMIELMQVLAGAF
jgi:catechol 2,3-dioxygenase-like lactoylglutathione lyase family enzyme